MRNQPPDNDLFHPDPPGKENAGGLTSHLYCEVIIPFPLPNTFTWSIPSYLQNAVKTGSRVEVQLKNKKYTGIVKTIHQRKPEAFEPKEILNILDEDPLVHEKQLQFWQWIAQYYLCTEGEVMQAAVPSNLKLSSESILIWNEEYGIDFTDLNDEEYIVAEALEVKKELRLSEVQQLLDVSHVYPVSKKLIDKQVCFIWEELKEKYKEKKETYLVLHPLYHDETNLSRLFDESKAPKQMELLLSFLHLMKTEGQVIQTQLLKKSGASAAQLKGLVDKKILLAEKRSANRIKNLPDDTVIDFVLSPAQQQAAGEITKVFAEKQVCLLHGITASGKTQLYVNLIEQYIKEGKQVLYL